jgi:hypothetical protein
MKTSQIEHHLALAIENIAKKLNAVFFELGTLINETGKETSLSDLEKFIGLFFFVVSIYFFIQPINWLASDLMVYSGLIVFLSGFLLYSSD